MNTTIVSSSLSEEPSTLDEYPDIDEMIKTLNDPEPRMGRRKCKMPRECTQQLHELLLPTHEELVFENSVLVRENDRLRSELDQLTKDFHSKGLVQQLREIVKRLKSDNQRLRSEMFGEEWRSLRRNLINEEKKNYKLRLELFHANNSLGYYRATLDTLTAHGSHQALRLNSARELSTRIDTTHRQQIHDWIDGAYQQMLADNEKSGDETGTEST